MKMLPLNWPLDSICLRPLQLDVGLIAADVYSRVCRTDFSAPGFCVLNLGRIVDSVDCQRLMVELKRQLAAIHEARTANTLVYLSLGRFDQQTTTRPHLDGGPEECLLMLGYELSDVDAELEIADYSRCAFDMGLTPKEFLARHNPMFQTGYEILRPFTTQISCFSPQEFQIVCINNSSAPFSRERPAWQGVLHTATIPRPDDSKRRNVNSTLIAPAPAGAAEPNGAEEQQEFVTTSDVRRRGHDMPHLEDDG